MENEISIEKLVELAQKDVEEAANYEIKLDDGKLAKQIYKRLFDFYREGSFSGDVIFTWKSPSLVKDGYYIGKRDMPVDNKRVIGNIFPNYKSTRKYSLNLNRNGNNGDFPHDYFDIYLDHVAKYAYNKERAQIKEYYPLKRAILYTDNEMYFKKFKSFEDFLERNYLNEIWKQSQENPFSNMEFDEFKDVSSKLMIGRGKLMLEKLLKNLTDSGLKK